MSNNKIEKAAKKKRVLYSEEAVTKALVAISKGLPINAASIQFGVPRSTLYDKVKGKYMNKKPGPECVLTESNENILVKWIIYMLVPLDFQSLRINY